MGVFWVAKTWPSAKRALFWLILLAIPVAFMEVVGFTATRILPELFDRREVIIARLRPDEFERFRETTASSTLGWDNPATTSLRRRNCANDEIVYTYDQDRLRVHDAALSREAAVLVAGDSYTEGAEVADAETFPAVLQRILGVPVANLGVGGYGPDQALLKLEMLIDRFPKARVLVLAIMYYDVYRMLNSYRPIMTESTGVQFGLKPYIRDGAFAPIPGGDPYRDFQSMVAAAENAFDHDFWRRPRSRFPYSVALFKATINPAVWHPAVNRLLRPLGWPPARLTYLMPPVRQGLIAIYERFAQLARSRKLAAVIVFIPYDGSDRTSGEIPIAATTEAERSSITFLNVGRDFDWAHYTGPTCHPNVNGYHMIATDVAGAVQPLLGVRPR